VCGYTRLLGCSGGLELKERPMGVTYESEDRVDCC
jgi:hypothetical protein